MQTARFSRFLGSLSLIVPLLAPAPDALAAERPPNLVLILADDLGLGDCGFQGGSAALTPHLDRLAAESLRFSDAYANGSVCARRGRRCCRAWPRRGPASTPSAAGARAR